MPTVLVTDGEQRSALAVVRSLGRAGYRVIVAAVAERTLAGVSRYADAHVRMPDPLIDPEAFVAAVQRATNEWHLDFVLPITEAAHLALLPHRDGLLPAVIPGPTTASFSRAADKEEVLRLAAAIGIAVPAQVVIGSPQVSACDAVSSLRFPVVAKPARSVGGTPGHRAKFGVLHAADVNALAALLTGLPSGAFPVLVQERIVGPGIGVFLLRWDLRTTARFAHRRLREKPPAGGVSVLSESIPANADLMRLAESLLEALDWNGVAMVEFKVDQVTGRPFLMEVNGRFWGSLQLAVDAGVDFPVLLLDASAGKPMGQTTGWRSGVRSRWFWGDIDHLLLRLFRSKAALALMPSEPSRFGALLRFLDWRPWRERDAIFRIADPLPFLHETLAWFRAL